MSKRLLESSNGSKPHSYAETFSLSPYWFITNNDAKTSMMDKITETIKKTYMIVKSAIAGLVYGSENIARA